MTHLQISFFLIANVFKEICEIKVIGESFRSDVPGSGPLSEVLCTLICGMGAKVFEVFLRGARSKGLNQPLTYLEGSEFKEDTKPSGDPLLFTWDVDQVQ